MMKCGCFAGAEVYCEYSVIKLTGTYVEILNHSSVNVASRCISRIVAIGQRRLQIKATRTADVYGDRRCREARRFQVFCER